MPADRRPLHARFMTHLHDVWGRLARSVPGGWVDAADPLMSTATGSPSPSFNLAIGGRTVTDGQPGPDPAAVLDAVAARFRAAGLGWLLKLHPELDDALVTAARRRGIGLDEEPVYARAIGAGTAPLRMTATSALSIAVADQATIHDAVACVAAGFEAPPEAIARELGPNLLSIPTFTVVVGSTDQEPVASAMLATTRSVGLAGIYSVATVPAHRGRGYGTAVTAAALELAVEQGYDTAVLEPSPAGEAMYRRMGFAPVTTTLEAIIGADEGR